MTDAVRKAYVALGILLVVSFGLSGIGRHKTRSDGGLYWVGASAWVAFGVILLVAVLLTVALAVRRLTRREGAS